MQSYSYMAAFFIDKRVQGPITYLLLQAIVGTCFI